MLYFKRSLITLLAICAIGLPISLLTVAADTTLNCDVCTSGCSACPPVVETSDGRIVTLTNVTDAKQEWRDYENYLADALRRMHNLEHEIEALDKAIAGDKTGLDDMILNLSATAAAGKRPDIGATILLIKALLTDIENELKKYDLKLDRIDTYARIDSLNQEIANKFSDRDKFWSALYQLEGSKREKQVKGSLEDMQVTIPPLGAECAGCGDWYYDQYFWEYYSAFTRGLKKGVGVPLDKVTDYAKQHRLPCMGCGESYYTCVPKDVEKHEIKYCQKKIILVLGGWPGGTKVLGICGQQYRNCDDPPTKADHLYMPEYEYSMDYRGRYIYWVKGYRGVSSKCGKGGTSIPPKSINGPNPFIPRDLDKTPNCDKCVDGSPNCPQANTHH